MAWDSLERIEAILMAEKAGDFIFTPDEVCAIQTRELLKKWVTHKTRLRKGVIVDLDGTLWDGILGEDGVKGLSVNPTQRALLEELMTLQRRGVWLAVATKNEMDDVQEALRLPLFDGFKPVWVVAVWYKKSRMVQEICRATRSLPSEVVFVDDSPHERLDVQMHLPDVFVASEPTVEGLRACQGLYAGPVTEEDHNRELYEEQDLARKAYLDLQQVVTFEELSSKNVNRAAQLCQRTNQFNVTLRRYTEQDLIEHSKKFGILMRVKDRFGDAGRCGFALVNNEAKVEVFCLSCRVIGRGLEDLLLREVVQRAKDYGWKRLTCQRIAGERNYPTKAFCEENFPHGALNVGQYLSEGPQEPS